MDKFNSMSDNELRIKLREFGCNLPITSTSRNVLINKLRNLVNSQQSNLKRATTFATRYSSDESDQESNRKIRTTMPPPKTNSKQRFTSYQPVATKISPRTSSVYVSPVVRHQHNDSEDDNDNERPNLNSSFSKSYGNSTISRNHSLGINALSSTNQTSSQTFLNSYDRSGHGGTSQPREQITTSNGHNIDLFPKDYLKRFSTSPIQRRSTLSSASVLPRRTIQQTTTSPTRKRHLNESFAASNESEIVYHADRQSHESPVPEFTCIGTALSNFFRKLNEQISVKQTFVPWIILGLFVTFFAIVAFMYISISPDLANTVRVQDTVYSMCSYDNNDADSVSCIRNEDLNSTLDLLKLTATELQKRIELNKCKDSTVPFTMSSKEVVSNAMQKSSNYPLTALIKDLNDMEYLIKMNPQWNIANCDSNGNKLDFDDVVRLRSTQSNYFVILKPQLPFMCSLYNKMGTFFTIIGWIGLIFSIVFVIYFIYRYIMGIYKANQDKKNLIISEIITALMEKAEDDPANPQVVVNHLRDKLLSSSNRSNLEWAWDYAINYLENNNSRIKFDIDYHNGEECRLMKWVDTAASSGGNRAFAKKWQCPAYDNFNRIRDPPTQCLKIRQMFEKHEVNNANLKQIIQDALLEKVGNKCSIHDIELDLLTCCVYVRCATTADAGMVHDLVNGWWFDGRLVSIKFLRIERYLSRFPQSTGVGLLKPSNTNNLSMSYCVEESGRVRPQGSADDD